MVYDRPHDMMVEESHDESARMGFVADFKRFLTNELSGGSGALYQRRVRPHLTKELGREPTRHEIRGTIRHEPYFQAVSALRRTSQEMIWDSSGKCVERQLPALVDRSRRYATKAAGANRLRLNPDLEMPRYLSAVDIHCMPGSYQGELEAGDDVFAGAMYDRGVHLYRAKSRPTVNDSNGTFMVSWLAERFPGFTPKRALDMGCGIGNATLRYAQSWPDAEIHAIDVGAAMLRYGHARAESLNTPLSFSQQNAERTEFADESFDLVVSFLLLHETSNRALRNIFRESHRLLAPGGVMVHVDSLPYADLSPWDQFVPDWDTHYNGEPFMGALHDLDLRQIAKDAGFQDKEIFEERPRHPGMSPHLKGANHSNDGNVNGEFLNLVAIRGER
jgi:ubiquinone/menaquinone biosynthesis C-methylase UbiE